MVLFVSVVFSILLQSVQMVTLEEGLKNPEKYIFYDQNPFNIGMHAGISLLITYSILAIVLTFITIISRALGYRRKRTV
ncbi:hypothetical protein CLF_107516 [Clonorchis sinensis]|uniref:Uncharacterized protein n=1 Tax=Clonorchis sinensis TaxID=79923 RepID=G7YQP5_CLOSI|nr:hypothetical protein CLF_107516 [Clonorchis sinensis]